MEPLEIEEAALRSSLIQQIVVIGQVLVRDFELGTTVWDIFHLFTFSYLIASQDQRRLGAIVIPNKEAAEGVAKNKISAVDPEVNELSKETLTSMVYEELRKW